MTYYGNSASEVAGTIQAQVAEAVAKAERATAFRDEIVQLRGRGSSDHATALVDHTGLLLDIRFEQSAVGLSTDALATTVLDAVRAAQADVAEVLHRRTAEVWGENDSVTRQMDREIGERFAPKTAGAHLEEDDR